MYSTFFSRKFIFWRSTRNFILVDTLSKLTCILTLILKVLFAKEFLYLTFFLENLYFGVLQENLTLAIYLNMISLAFHEKLYFCRFNKSSLSAVLFFLAFYEEISKTHHFQILAFYDFGVLLATDHFEGRRWA